MWPCALWSLGASGLGMVLGLGCTALDLAWTSPGPRLEPPYPPAACMLVCLCAACLVQLACLCAACLLLLVLLLLLLLVLVFLLGF